MISEQQGFNAMRMFLDQYWRSRGQGDEIRLLLSSMDTSFSADGMPTDIALWEEWLTACEQAKNSGS